MFILLQDVIKKCGNFVFYVIKETLTGFKWMGNIADGLLKKGKHVLFAFEEAIGIHILLSQILLSSPMLAWMKEIWT